MRLDVEDDSLYRMSILATLTSRILAKKLDNAEVNMKV